MVPGLAWTNPSELRRVPVQHSKRTAPYSRDGACFLRRQQLLPLTLLWRCSVYSSLQVVVPGRAIIRPVDGEETWDVRRVKVNPDLRPVNILYCRRDGLAAKPTAVQEAPGTSRNFTH